MKHLKHLYLQATNNFWFKLLSSLFIIGTSFYDIMDDISKLRKEHFLLTLGVVLLLKSILELLDKIKETSEKLIKETTGR